jgi:hypothetical protein
MVNNSGALLDTTSALDSTGTSFTVTYGNGASPPVSPPPPASPPPASPPPPVSPPPVSPPPVSPPPAPGSIATTTTLTGRVDPYTFVPTVIFTATVSPSVPVGSLVGLFDGSTLLGYGKVRSVGGVDKVTFYVSFYAAGTYTFTAEYMGSGNYAASISNEITVTVTQNGVMHHHHHHAAPIHAELRR